MKRRGTLANLGPYQSRGNALQSGSELSCSIVIASPDAEVRRRWRQELGKGYTISETSELVKLKAIIRNLKPSIVLFDLALSKLQKSSNLMTLNHLNHASKIIALTSVCDEKEEVMMLEVGARGYCNVDMDPALIRKAVQAVQKGEIWVGRSIISVLVQKLNARKELMQKSASSNAFPLTGLTPRERQIANMVASAASNKQIAVQLDITEATVKAHLTDIFRRLGVTDRLELALFVASQIGTAII